MRHHHKSNFSVTVCPYRIAVILSIAHANRTVCPYPTVLHIR